MKRVVTDICNSLLAVSMSSALRYTGDFFVRSISDDLIAECQAAGTDVALMEVAYNMGFTMDERLGQAAELRRKLPSCKVLLLCDENSAPELAKSVAQAKKDGLIDDFIYSSVSESYLIAMLESI